MGKLLRSIDLESRQVVATYDIRLSLEENGKNLIKFGVPKLEQCASAMSIKIKKEDGKKLFNKALLIRKVLLKIKAHLPHQCVECKEEYTVGLCESPLFTCYQCMKPSHNCETLARFNSALPPIHPKGFIWMCEACLDDPDAQINSAKVSDNEDKNKSKEQETEVTKECAPSEIDLTDTKPQEKKLCKYYIYKNCKYGDKGKNCPYNHPKKCFRFMQNGNKSSRGCIKGKECKFFHPPICRSSMRIGMCLKKECRYHHIKGTRFSNEHNFETSVNFGKTDPGNSSRQHANLNNFKISPSLNEDTSALPDQPSYASKVSASRGVQFGRERTQAGLEKDGLQRYDDAQLNFQELRHQIQQMQVQIQKLFLLGSPQQAAINQCRCQTKCH